MDTDSPAVKDDARAPLLPEEEGDEAGVEENAEAAAPVEYSDFSAGERERRALARKRRTLLQVSVGTATVAIPLAYLYANGNLKGLRHRPAAPIVVPSSKAVSKGNLLPAPPARTAAISKQDAAVAADLGEYFKSIKSLHPAEQVALDAYASATGKNYTGEANSFRIIREQVLPKYIDLVKQAAKIKPKTAEVRALQALFLNSIELRLLAYRHIAEAEHAKGNAWHLTVGAELQSSDIASQRFKDAAIALADQVNVKLPDQ